MFDLILAMTMLSNFGKVLYFLGSSFVLQLVKTMSFGWLSDDLIWRGSLNFIVFEWERWWVERQVDVFDEPLI